MGEEESFTFQCQRDILHRMESNHRPSRHERDALPTELQCIAWISTIQSPTKYYLLIMSRCPTRRADNKLVWFTYLNRPLISYIRLFSCVLNHNGWFVLFRVSFAVCGLKVSIPRWAPWRLGTPKYDSLCSSYAHNVRELNHAVGSQLKHSLMRRKRKRAL